MMPKKIKNLGFFNVVEHYYNNTHSLNFYRNFTVSYVEGYIGLNVSSYMLGKILQKYLPCANFMEQFLHCPNILPILLKVPASG